MPLNKKRKSESVSLTDEAATPAKKERKEREVVLANTRSSTPKRPDGPKRGRGRPRKDPSAIDTPKSATPKEGKRPVGRPRKFEAQNGTNSSTEKSKRASIDSKAEDNSGRSYWLMKAEPESRLEKGVDVKFSIDDLRAAKEPEPWDGVRNPAGKNPSMTIERDNSYQETARNHLREMKVGDYAFFYHSNCKVPGIAGVMEIVREHSTDESAFDPAHPYYDENSKRESPKWVVVHVKFQRKLTNPITLNELKAHGGEGGALANLQMLKQSRLSVSAVNAKEWDFIMGLAEGEDESADESSKENTSGENEAESSE
ncbi:hypothetical protein AOCH_003225 [Aspergillus ochraceoroseus]|uniref:Thymocyte nuclear protein 1 n=1 Tax=Aspergillus ochraceoroseus TaxID=138278 RepID=A0A0F8WVB4_9EURO|nr:hypothetical protein AOCH_003225 [Aspergillus ochraceoroseus]